MPSRRPTLSAPSYGAYTGRINWSRGMSESLAQTPATSFTAPAVQPTITSSTPTSSSSSSFINPKLASLKERDALLQ